MRCVYVDLDGTLLGPNASLVGGPDGTFSHMGIRALEACHRVGAQVVIMTGRRKAQAMEDARLIGQTAYIFEAGSCLVIDGEETWLTGEYQPGERSIHDQIEASGAPKLLLDTYADKLEYHDPWHMNREVSHLFRGLVDAFEADELLEANGHKGLRLVDNGSVNRRSEKLADLPQVRAYHLVPKGASKANAVARHMQIMGYTPEDVIAVGDSREDLGTAAHVGQFWFVSNALKKDPTIAEAIRGTANARIAEAPFGEGVYEAVVTRLSAG